jgi:hypothetical protein
MKKLFILMILATSLGLCQLYAQPNPNFRFASTTLTHQIIDSIVTTGTAVGVPVYGNYPLGQVIKNKFTKDANGNLLDQTDYYINISAFPTLKIDPVTKYTNTFDANDKMTVSITARWDKIGLQFVDSLKYECAYPVNDVCVETVYKKVASSWVFSDSIKVVTTYNANQDPSEKVTYASIAGIWTDSIKETNTYDGLNRLITKIISTWNGSVYVNFKKTNITYGPSTGTAVLQDWTGSAWVNTIYTATVPGYGTYNVNTVSTVYHSTVNKIAAPVIENVIDAIKTYPNPTVDGFYVNAGDSKKVTVNVISVKGELLIEKEVTGTEYIRVNHIGKGTFLVKISSEGKSVTRKLYVK